jgi:hypothetical protein
VTKRSIASVAVVLAVLDWPALAAAQDAHYWTYGYGPIGQLTEGTLVGGVNDLSAVYYNPAACALMDKPRFVFTLNSIELANIEVPGAAGEGLNIDQLVFDVVPAMVAGHIGQHDGEQNHFAYAFLARHDSDFDLGYDATQVSGATPAAAAGFGRFRQRLVEYWVGGTWSRRVSDRVSVGVSPFFAYRGQRSRRSLTLEEVTASASRAAFFASENEYNHFRLLGKLGVAWRPGRWELGATVTTPGVKLWGSGKTVFNASTSGEGVTPILSASTQEGLSPTYRSPWSAAAGATRRWTTTAVHTTVEWFSAVDPYDILPLEPAPIAGSADTVLLTYTGAAESVVNFGLGLEKRLSDTLVLYGGAARNHSAYVAERDAFAAWDLTDVTAGFTVDRGRRRLALGIGYAWGSEDLPQVITPPGQATPPQTRAATFSRWTISIGASFNVE